MDRRRLFVDIETSPLTVYVFSLNDPSNAHISPDNIKEDRAVICIGYKWSGEKQTHAISWNRKHSDREMLKAFIPVLESASEVIAHNGDRFDLPWIRWRCIVHNIPMPPRIASFDTYKELNGKVRAPSLRLNYLGRELVGDTKLETKKGLWGDVMENKPGSLEQMISYCKQDVRLLEKVFNRVRPWLEAKTTIAANSRDCPECGSQRTRKHDTRTSAKNGSRTVQFRCNDCGSFHSIKEARFESNKPLAAA